MNTTDDGVQIKAKTRYQLLSPAPAGEASDLILELMIWP